VFKLEQWRQKAEAALEGALKEREADPADGQLAAAMRRIGELVVREKASLRHASTHPIAHRGMAGSTAATIRTLMRRRRPASAARTQA
jgi:hypothetical protein